MQSESNAVVPVVVYAAKSTKDDHGSCESQLAECRAHVARQEGWEVADDHEDKDESAYHGSRGPGLIRAQEQAAELAQEHGTALLLAWKSDRLARGDGIEGKHLVERLLEARKGGYRLLTLADHIDSTSPMAVAMAGMMGDANHAYSASISAHVKRRKRRDAERGWHTSHAPYGYRQEGKHGERRWIVEPTEATIVGRVWREYEQGAGLRTIMLGLNADNVPTAKRQGRWSKSAVERLLDNPAYAGFVRHQEELFDADSERFPSIFPDARDRWQEIQQRRQARRSQANGGRGRRPKLHLLPSSLLRCECGHGWYAAGDRYVCSLHQEDPAACSMPSISRRKLDGRLRAKLAAYLDEEATRRQIRVAAEAKLGEAEALADSAAQEALRADESVSRVDRDYAAGQLDPGRYARLAGALEEEREGAHAEAERCKQRVEELKQVLDVEAQVLDGLAAMRQAIRGEVESAETVEALRGALERLFRCFVLTRDSRGELRLVPFYREDHIRPLVEDGELPTGTVVVSGKGPSGLPPAPCCYWLSMLWTGWLPGALTRGRGRRSRSPASA